MKHFVARDRLLTTKKAAEVTGLDPETIKYAGTPPRGPGAKRTTPATTLGKGLVKVKRALKARGITYQDVADAAGVSWHMVWAVLNGRKTSARVLETAHRLLEASLAMRRPRRPSPMRPSRGDETRLLALFGGPVSVGADRLAAISQALDDHVHTALAEAADADAVRINLEGLTAQLDYLRGAMGDDLLRSVVASAVEESARYLPGAAVEGAARS